MIGHMPPTRHPTRTECSIRTSRSTSRRGQVGCRLSFSVHGWLLPRPDRCSTLVPARSTSFTLYNYHYTAITGWLNVRLGTVSVGLEHTRLLSTTRGKVLAKFMAKVRMVSLALRHQAPLVAIALHSAKVAANQQGRAGPGYSVAPHQNRMSTMT